MRQAAEEDPKAAALRLKYRLMPFSHGTRACPGYGFAMMQVCRSGLLLMAGIHVHLAVHSTAGVCPSRAPALGTALQVQVQVLQLPSWGTCCKDASLLMCLQQG